MIYLEIILDEDKIVFGKEYELWNEINNIMNENHIFIEKNGKYMCESMGRLEIVALKLANQDWFKEEIKEMFFASKGVKIKTFYKED